MSAPKHTPGRWEVTGTAQLTIRTADHDYAICDLRRDRTNFRQQLSNAQRIVTAVNCHDELVEALKRTRHALEELHSSDTNSAQEHFHDEEWRDLDGDNILTESAAIIARATGGNQS